MAKQVIQLGTAVNDGTGDPLRTAFTKVNANFTELYNGQFSGSYADLTNKPTIPTDVSDLTDTESLLGGGSADTGDWTFTGNVAYNGTNYNQGLYVAPGGESTSYIYVPGNSESDSTALQITNGSSTGQVVVNVNNKQWNFDGEGVLSLPENGDIVDSNGTSVIGGVSPVQPHLELTNIAFFNPVSFTKSDYGDEVDVIVEDAEADTLRETYLEAEAMWVDARDADAADIAPDTRPWDGMSSIDAYPVLINAEVQTPPAPSNFPPLLNSANNAYTAWQESLATSTGIAITRGVQQGVYNPYRDNSWDSDVSPTGTLWNVDGWDDLTDVESREYLSFMDAYNGNLGNNVPGSSAIMYVPSTDLYYAVQWTSWTPNNAGGGFSYTRSEIDLTQLNEGITFADGTVQKTAYSRVKSTASNDRRIEEVTGSSEVSVTAVSYGATQDATIRSTSDSWDFYVDATEDLNNLYDGGESSFRYLEFSFDGETTWIPVTFGGGTPGVSYQMVFEDDRDRPVVQGRVVRYRVVTGGDPVTWWDKAALPGGSNDFRGAVIDYHAYTGEATWIGTIHIADDDGDETITHTEVSSGSTDSMNDDLWYVTSEGRIQYRRFDGESKTLKVHWVAKVFYGSELYD